MEISVKQCIYCEKHVPKRDPNNFIFIKEMICYNCWLKLPLHMFEVSNVPLYIPKEQYKQYFKAKFKQYQFKRLSNGHVYRKVS